MKLTQKIFNKIIKEYETTNNSLKLTVLFELLCDEYSIDYTLEYLDAHILNFDAVDTYIDDVLELNK